MRIVHLATTDISGGAARSAYRLHRGLLELGEDSTMLVQRKSSNDSTVQQLPRSQHPLAFYGELLQSVAIDRNRSEVSNTHFSLGWPGQDVSGHPLVQAADVIHLHWVSGFQSSTDLARLLALGKKAVWTLHDLRPFTGGCHFSAGCRKYETDCARCPQLADDPFSLAAAVLADQVRALANVPLAVVTPSQWLTACARRSRVFAGTAVETIPYGIDTTQFLPMPKAEARRQIGMPEEGFLLLTGADHGAEHRKGFHKLSEALQACGADPAFRRRIEQGQITLLCFGRPSEALKALPVPVKSLGYIESDAILRAVYSAADLFVLPSLEDNLPNTILESMSCGTPAAAFNVGGVPDLIENDKTGFMAPEGDAPALSQILLDAVAQPEKLAALRTTCRRQAEENFTLALQARRYRQLYEQPQPGTLRTSPSDLLPGPAVRTVFAPQLLSGLERFGPPMPPPPDPADRVLARKRRRFSRKVWALLKKAAAGRVPVRSLFLRLEALWSVFEGGNPLAAYAKLWLRILSARLAGADENGPEK